MRNITVIAKVTNGCNLNCPYCYNRSRLNNMEKMSLKTLEKILFNIAMEYDSAMLIFHGGEPTLMGYDWYKKAFDLINKYKAHFNIEIKMGIQTNLTVSDKKLYDLLIENGVGIGVSYDGLINDTTRKNTAKFKSNVDMLKDKTDINAICIVTKNNHMNLVKELEHFTEMGISNAKLNLVYNTQTMSDELATFSVEEITKSYCDLYNHTASSEKPTVFDDTFVRYIKLANFDLDGVLCENMNCLNKWISVHPDGSTYPCGQEWQQNDEYMFPNIMENLFSEIYASEGYQSYSKEVMEKMEECKKTCPAYKLCYGGCPAKTLANTGSIKGYDEAYCHMHKGLIQHIYSYNSENEIKNPKYLETLRRYR